MYRAVKAGRTVIYSSQKGGRAVFKNGKAYDWTGALRSLKDLSDPTALYLSDSLPPVAFRGAFQLLITSPKKATWSEFAKSSGVQDLVLPMFTKAEVMELRDVAFSKHDGCSEDEVASRFGLWGGSARSVLTHATRLRYQESLTLAANHLTSATLVLMLNGLSGLEGTAGEDTIHRLLNIVPRGALEGSELKQSDPNYYRFHHAQLVSKHVEDIFAKNLLNKDKAELYHFLHATAAIPGASTYRGSLYERGVVIPLLAHGDRRYGRVKLVIEKLSSARSAAARGPVLLQSDQDFERLPLILFATTEELQAEWAKDGKDAIFVPRNTNFPVVDFVLRIKGQAWLANATLSASHGIKAHNATFAKVVRAVGLGSEEQEVPFLWFLDEPAFKGFTKPGKVDTEGTDLPTGIDGLLAQYKVQLKVPGRGVVMPAAAVSSTS
jgi:hypothetical protein